MFGRWTDPRNRQDWVRERLNDPVNSKPVIVQEPWADYQRQVTGNREVRVGTGSDAIWVDGLQVDPDTVVAAEAKYIANPDRSMYEGRVPAAMEDRLLRQFDGEMRRYRRLALDPANPVGRVRIITSTPAAAHYLGQRARRVLGPDIDLDVRHEPLKGHP